MHGSEGSDRSIQKVDTQANAALQDAAHRLGGIGKGAATIAGAADDLATLTEKANSVFGQVQHTLGDIISANRQIAERATQGVSSAEKTHSAVRTALDRAQGLADAVERVEGGITHVSGALRQVADASSAINRIAFQTRIVAFNASVEAVRAGDAGRGFGVVAQAVKDLAQQVGDSSRQIAVVIDELTERVQALERQVNQQGAGLDKEDVKGIVQQAIESFETNFGQVEALMKETARTSTENLSLCDVSVATLQTFGTEFSHSLSLIKDVRAESGKLLETSEEAIQEMAAHGVVTEDSLFIDAALRTAAEISAVFENAVAQNRISLNDLFDEHYAPVAGSDPQQFLTRYIALTDELLPPIQEPILALSPQVTFCAAIDRKGYLPTHNLIFSQPQGRDPVKNALSSRNRRIFNDRTGLRAARNKAPFLLQTYRRDMGRGDFVLMKDVSAPIIVQGRHWGALRIGYCFAD